MVATSTMFTKTPVTIQQLSKVQSALGFRLFGLKKDWMLSWAKLGLEIALSTVYVRQVPTAQEMYPLDTADNSGV